MKRSKTFKQLALKYFLIIMAYIVVCASMLFVLLEGIEHSIEAQRADNIRFLKYNNLI